MNDVTAKILVEGLSDSDTLLAYQSLFEISDTWFLRMIKAEHATRGYYDEDGNWQCGLYSFLKYFWDVLEPETPLLTGWALQAMCQHLEAVSYGEIQRLLINVPPGFMKSLLVDVFWPAWEWATGKAHLRYVTFSYSATLTERDNDRFGKLVTSDKYQNLYSDVVRITACGMKKVANDKTGWKFASSIGGVGTGERGDRVILDDPHNVKEAESDVVRKETIRWFRESMSSRMNDMRKSAVVIIMQRVHEEDVSGVILEMGLPYCHLCIPMEFESAYQFNDDGSVRANEIGWIDPRFDPDDVDGSDGILAWEERFPADIVQSLKEVLGPYAYAGQMQQRPAPRTGGIFERHWWQLWESPDGRFPVFEYLIASLDSAFTEKEQNDPSGFTVWGIFVDEKGNRRIMLVNAWRKHLAFSGPRIPKLPRETVDAYRIRTQKTWGLMEWVHYTCMRFKVDKLLIEAKASGISAAQELRNRYTDSPFAIQLCQVSGDKVSRALACQPTFSQLMVFAPSSDWAQMMIDEAATFPNSRYKDLTDSMTQAIRYLRDHGLAQTDEEVTAAENRNVAHRPQMKPIYPA